MAPRKISGISIEMVGRISRKRLNKAGRIMVKAARARRMRLGRSLMGPKQKSIYYYKQAVLNAPGIGSIVIPGGATTFLAGYSFNLGQLAAGNLAAFQALYDQFKITKVVLRLIPKGNLGPAGVNPLGNVASCIDYDDANPPATFDDVLERQNFKLTRYGQIHTRVLKPCVNYQTQLAGVSTKQSPWLDINSFTQPHFGLKYAITSTAQQQEFDTLLTFYLAFKQVR